MTKCDMGGRGVKRISDVTHPRIQSNQFSFLQYSIFKCPQIFLKINPFWPSKFLKSFLTSYSLADSVAFERSVISFCHCCFCTRFFYKHHLYKHRQPEIWPKIKHHPSTSPSLTFLEPINFVFSISCFPYFSDLSYEKILKSFNFLKCFLNF